MIIKRELVNSSISLSHSLEIQLLQVQILFRRGLYAEVINKIERIIPSCKQIREILLEFNCYFIISNSAARIGDFDNTIHHVKSMEDCLQIMEKQYHENYKSSLSDLFFIKALIARYQSKSSEAIDYYRECLEMRKELGDHYGMAEPRNHLGIIYDHLGNYEIALKEYQQAIHLFSIFEDKIAVVGVMSNLGLIYWEQGKLEKSQEIYLSALNLVNDIPKYDKIGPLFLNIGLVAIDLGKLNEAKKNIEEALKHFKNSEDKRGLLLGLMNLGITYDLLWEFDSALKNYYQAVEYAEQIGNKNELLKLLINIGITHKNQNKLDSALEYFNKAHKLNLSLMSSLGQSKILFLLATTYLQLDKIEEVEDLQSQLYELALITDIKVVDRTSRLLNGIILKTKSGLTNRAKASEIFSFIVREESVSYEIAMSSIVNLCEILVTEVQVTKNEADLKEIEFLIKKLEQLSDENPSTIVKVNILLMKSRIAFMLERIDEAIDLLENASSLAEVKKIKYLSHKVQEERMYLENKAMTMQQVGGIASAKLDLIGKRNSDYIDFLKENFNNFIQSN